MIDWFEIYICSKHFGEQSKQKTWSFSQPVVTCPNTQQSGQMVRKYSLCVKYVEGVHKLFPLLCNVHVAELFGRELAAGQVCREKLSPP